jgi:hypothetical protein
MPSLTSNIFVALSISAFNFLPMDSFFTDMHVNDYSIPYTDNFNE